LSPREVGKLKHILKRSETTIAIMLSKVSNMSKVIQIKAELLNKAREVEENLSEYFLCKLSEFEDGVIGNVLFKISDDYKVDAGLVFYLFLKGVALGIAYERLVNSERKEKNRL